MVVRTSRYAFASSVPWYYGYLWTTYQVKERHNQGKTDRVAEARMLWCPIPLNLIARLVRWVWSFVRYPQLLTNDKAGYWEAKYKALMEKQ